jgi:hypothetical protein
LWVVIALVSLAVFFILVLCVPLDLLLRVDTDGRPKFSMRLAWFFGLVSRELRREKKKAGEEKATCEPKRKPRERRIGARAIFELLRTKGLLGQLGSLIKNIFSRIKIRELVVNLKVALDNPADTGLLFAFIAPVSLLLSSFFPNQISVQSSFSDELTLEGYLYGALRMRPIQLVIPLVGFAFSLPIMRAAKTLVLTKCKGKQ